MRRKESLLTSDGWVERVGSEWRKTCWIRAVRETARKYQYVGTLFLLAGSAGGVSE